MLEKISFLFGLLVCIILIILIAVIAIGGTALIIYAVKEIKEELLDQ